jgi:hypothetical protein
LCPLVKNRLKNANESLEKGSKKRKNKNKNGKLN